jgi:hypothetical protein
MLFGFVVDTLITNPNSTQGEIFMKKLLATLVLLFSMGVCTLAPAEARHYGYDRYNGGYGYHPYVQKALIGGGVGAVAGGLLGRRDPVGAGIKGALLGSAAGLGYEYLRQSSYGGYGGYRGYDRGYRGYTAYGGNGYGRRGCGGPGRGYGHRHHHRRNW